MKNDLATFAEADRRSIKLCIAGAWANDTISAGRAREMADVFGVSVAEIEKLHADEIRPASERAQSNQGKKRIRPIFWMMVLATVAWTIAIYASAPRLADVAAYIAVFLFGVNGHLAWGADLFGRSRRWMFDDRTPSIPVSK